MGLPAFASLAGGSSVSPSRSRLPRVPLERSGQLRGGDSAACLSSCPFLSVSYQVDQGY